MEGVTGECEKGEKRGVDKVGAGHRDSTGECRAIVCTRGAVEVQRG